MIQTTSTHTCFLLQHENFLLVSTHHPGYDRGYNRFLISFTFRAPCVFSMDALRILMTFILYLKTQAFSLFLRPF